MISGRHNMTGDSLAVNPETAREDGVAELRRNLMHDRREVERFTAGMPSATAAPYFELIDREIATLDSLLTELAGLRTALSEFEQAVTPLLGTMNFYFGPGARTATGAEMVRKYRLVQDAVIAARALLAVSETPPEGEGVKE